jgi:spermidine/putrescine transport system ATP-binding protein
MSPEKGLPTAQPGSLTLKGVAKFYGGEAAVADTTLSVPAGTYVVLLGPSGSGKTTLLSMIGGFTTPSRGEIRLGSADVTGLPPARRPTATVFQDYALFPHMSVGANVGFGLSVRGLPRADCRRKAEEALRLVGLEGYAERRIHQLSGGQRQRVALARALVVEPAVLLLDEPLGALDLHLRRTMQDELKRLQRSTGRSFVHVTHDQEEAMALADLVVIMNKGRIEDMGSPDRVYMRPASRFAATFMGESNLIEGRVLYRDGSGCAVETPLGTLLLDSDADLGSALAIAIRPENLKGRPARDGEVSLGIAIVEETAFQGSYARVRLRAGQGAGTAGIPLLLKSAPAETPHPGDRIPLSVDPRAVSALPA